MTAPVTCPRRSRCSNRGRRGAGGRGAVGGRRRILGRRGVAGLWVARDDGAAKARRIVTLGAPLAGTSLAATATVVAPDACPAACRQLAPGSAEITELTRARVGEALPWLSVWTADDETVTPPATASQLAGAVPLQVQASVPGRPGDAFGVADRPGGHGTGAAGASVDPLATGVAGDCAEVRAAG